MGIINEETEIPENKIAELKLEKITINNISTRRIRIIIGRNLIRITPGETVELTPGQNKFHEKLLKIIETKHNKEFVIIKK